jgi:hypothetical protein
MCNSITTKSRSINGAVILNTTKKLVTLYDAEIIPQPHRGAFYALVDEWLAAITSATTSLPVSLYHGEKFDHYEPALIMLDAASIIEIEGYAYCLAEHFNQDYCIRRYTENGAGAIVKRRYASGQTYDIRSVKPAN